MKKLLFCLGVTKGGTTWLHWTLCKHPEIMRIPRKEIHYFLRQYGGLDRLTDAGRLGQYASFVRETRFDPDHRETPLARVEVTDRDAFGSPWDEEMQRAWSERGQSTRRFKGFVHAADWYKTYLRGPVNDDWYRNLFRRVPDHKWAMDFSTTSFQVNEAGFARMAEFAEETRAIFVLRDPIDRLWSHLRFHAEVVGGLRPIDGWTTRELRAFVDKHGLAESSFYADALTYFLRHFPEDRRMVINFEDIRSRPEELFQEILTFMDLPLIDLPVRNKEDVRINVSPPSPLPRGLFAHVAADIEADLQRVVDLGFDFAEPWMDHAAAHKRERPQLSRTIPRGVGLRTIARKFGI